MLGSIASRNGTGADRSAAEPSKVDWIKRVHDAGIAGEEGAVHASETVVLAVDRELVGFRDRVHVGGEKRQLIQVHDDLLPVGGNLDGRSLAEGCGVGEIGGAAVEIDLCRSDSIDDPERAVGDGSNRCGVGYEREARGGLVLWSAGEDVVQAFHSGNVSKLQRISPVVVELADELKVALILNQRNVLRLSGECTCRENQHRRREQETLKPCHGDYSFGPGLGFALGFCSSEIATPGNRAA